jgi:hypothetical protein
LIKKSGLVEKLETALKDAKEDVRMSKVEYIDYEKDTMPDGNIIFPVIHKQHAYSYEQEVRLIYEISGAPVHGIYIPIDIETLVDEVVVGPFTPRWQFELIIDISSKYGLKKPIRQSRLNTPD